MPPSLEERRPAITPQLALRVALLGGFAFVLFAIVFFRLWFLQVLTGEDYVSQARENRVRKVRIEAPRGDIVDRNNRKLVRTRVAPVAVGAAATAIAALGLTLLQFLLGVEAPVSAEVVRQILMTIVLNTLLALPVYAVCRRVLLPFLPDDPRRRRRRAYTTGGLSPLSRA